MSRWRTVVLVAGLGSGVAGAQQQTPAPEVKPPAEEQVQMPPEEDKAVLPKEYKFNPVQADREVRVGEFYFKKGDFKAAALRFREATRWNDGNATAWLLLGETLEKNHSPKEAREAYSKYLSLSPDAKNSGEVKKRMERIK
jgi:Flp pilus assembly protein TadD